MSRLTEKVKDMDIYIKLPTKEKQAFLDKLGQYEDLGEVDDLKADKQVLDVIIKKKVDIWLVESCFTVKQYNSKINEIDDTDIFNLTEVEFEMIKRRCGK